MTPTLHVRINMKAAHVKSTGKVQWDIIKFANILEAAKLKAQLKLEKK